MAKFTDYNLRSEIYTALEEIRFTTPTKVQERLIPVVMQGRSVVGQSQTGSGKTHTFLIPIFQKYDPSVQKVQAVITTPSRELAQQIYAAAKQLGTGFPVDQQPRIGLYVGGTGASIAPIGKLTTTNRYRNTWSYQGLVHGWCIGYPHG